MSESDKHKDIYETEIAPLAEKLVALLLEHKIPFAFALDLSQLSGVNDELWWANLKSEEGASPYILTLAEAVKRRADRLGKVKSDPKPASSLH